MKNFLVLYCAPAEIVESWSKMSEEDQKKGMEEWMVWQSKYEDRIVDPGNPVGENTRLKSSGKEIFKNEIGGYGVFKAESAEEVYEMLSENPHLKEQEAYMEVMEIVEMG